MQKTQQLNQKQREEFKDTLREVYRKADRALSEKSAEARDKALQKTLEHYGVVELTAAFQVTRQELDRLEKELDAKGFEVYREDIRISNNAPDGVEKTYEAFLSEQIGPEKKRVEELSEAIRNSWSIESLSEAKQLLAALAQ